jgi:iron complex transport system ATP-binding protein
MSLSVSPAALSVRDLQVTLGGRHGRTVIRGLGLDLPAGRWTAVVGPNGAGKSTLLATLAGLRAAQGQILWQGRPLAQWAERERARHLVWLAQGQGGGEDLSVWDVAMLGRVPHQPWLGAPSAEDERAVARALAAVGADGWRERALGQLSGGERQRVLLARALATEAQVLLRDEPLANLDPPHQADWVGIARALVAQGKTVVSVLHELNIALMADELVVLQHGQLRHQGRCGDARTHRALEAVFDQRIRVRAEAGPPATHWVSLELARHAHVPDHVPMEHNI